MRFTQRLTIDGKEVRLLSDRWYLEAGAPGRGILSIASTEPRVGLVTYEIGWNGHVEPWFTGYVHTSIAIDAKQQRVRVHEVDTALRLPAPVALRNATVSDLLVPIAAATGVTWSVGPGVPLQARFAHLVHLGTARAALHRLGELLAIETWTVQALPTGEVYLGPAAGLRPPVLEITPRLLSDVTTTGAGIRAVPRIRPGCQLRPGNGHTMHVHALELSAETYRLHWRRA